MDEFTPPHGEVAGEYPGLRNSRVKGALSRYIMWQKRIVDYNDISRWFLSSES